MFGRQTRSSRANAPADPVSRNDAKARKMVKLRRSTAALAFSAVCLAVTPSLAHAQSSDVVGTIVRFSGGDASVDVTIGEDNPTVRDFLSLLPVTIELEELNGREKIGYFSRKLTTDGSPGSDPGNGDLIYFSPWGNIGFYYNAAGIEYSDLTIHIGTYDATQERLERLASGPVTVEIVE
jgi:hypothetical protein